MCRALSEGGRRCPCNGGSRRRAYQRARYALKVAAAASTPAPDHSAPTPARGGVTETRQHALSALATFRKQRPKPGTPECAAYLSAVTDHGDAVREEFSARVGSAMDSAGVGDAEFNALKEQRKRWVAGQHDYDREVNDLMSAQTAIKDDNPNTWYKDPELSAQVKVLGEQWSKLMDDRFNEQVRIDTELRNMASTRRNVYAKEMTECVKSLREHGEMPRYSSLTKLTKKDTAMLEEVFGAFPADMVRAARDRSLPLKATRSKARAHFTSRETPKRKITYDAHLDVHDLLRDGPLWDRNYRHVPRDDDDYRHPYDDTLPDTPENRERLAEKIAAYDQKAWKRWKGRQAPQIVEVPVKVADDVWETRLSVAAKGFSSRMTRDRANIVSSLVFNDRESAAHEFGHYIEANNPEVGYACKEFLRKRTEGLDSKVYHTSRAYGTERVKEDGFVKSYIGKDYPSDANHTEVFSMGVEAVFAGAHGGLVDIDGYTAKDRKSDPEHLSLILGLLSVANADYES